LKLDNKIIFLTGAGKGIGRDLFQSFLKSGSYVFALTRSKEDLKKLTNIEKKNSTIFYGDVRNSKLIKKIFEFSIKKKKIINGIINNAGVRQRKKFDIISQKEVNDIFEINFFSIFKIMQTYVKYCKKLKIKSSIVNIGSIVGETGFSELCGYGATKGALKSMTQCFSEEYASQGIRANVVNPGFTKTSYFEKFKKKKKLYEWTLNKIPARRWGNTNEISELVKFLISDESSFITGENINIDGGWIKR
jgi:NAD(P)-dependent dehydrogenase (short-subunit alcohol dehydrogenase family)